MVVGERHVDRDLVAQLESALEAYRGAFVVVSHDERFLSEIRVDRRLTLTDGRLRDTGTPAGR